MRTELFILIVLGTLIVFNVGVYIYYRFLNAGEKKNKADMRRSRELKTDTSYIKPDVEYYQSEINIIDENDMEQPKVNVPEPEPIHTPNKDEPKTPNMNFLDDIDEEEKVNDEEEKEARKENELSEETSTQRDEEEQEVYDEDDVVGEQEDEEENFEELQEYGEVTEESIQNISLEEYCISRANIFDSFDEEEFVDNDFDTLKEKNIVMYDKNGDIKKISREENFDVSLHDIPAFSFKAPKTPVNKEEFEEIEMAYNSSKDDDDEPTFPEPEINF